MAEIEIGLGAVISDKHFAMLARAHRARVDVQIRIELAQPDFIAPCLQQCPECCGSDTLA